MAEAIAPARPIVSFDITRIPSVAPDIATPRPPDQPSEFFINGNGGTSQQETSTAALFPTARHRSDFTPLFLSEATPPETAILAIHMAAYRLGRLPPSIDRRPQARVLRMTARLVGATLLEQRSIAMLFGIPQGEIDNSWTSPLSDASERA